MTSKKKRPISTKSSNSKPTKSHQKVLIAIMLVLLLIVVGYLVWARSLSDASTPVASVPSANEQTEAVQAPSISVEDRIDSANSADNSTETDERAESTVAQTSNMNPSTILNAPLPQTDSLAKEEIDRLQDEQQRLAEQEKLAAEQVTMNKQLTDMKTEQIELLEQQIAQLEAKETAENAAE